MSVDAFNEQILVMAWRATSVMLLRVARILHAAIRAHHIAVTSSLFDLQVYLANLDPDLRFFGLEGAGTGVFARETRDPGAKGWMERFLEQTSPDHAIAFYTGCGMRLAMQGGDHTQVIQRFSSLDRWFVLNGLGFMRVLLDFGRYRQEREPLAGLNRSEQRIADRGVGRACWFRGYGDVAAVAEKAHAFSVDRRPDVWQGVGVASTFAGGVEPEALVRLLALAAPYQAELAVGAVMSAGTRFNLGAVTHHTQRAAEILAGTSPEQCAARLGEARRSVGQATSLEAFEAAWHAGLLRRP
jgi:enediyne biosynthesis protein E3